MNKSHNLSEEVTDCAILDLIKSRNLFGQSMDIFQKMIGEGQHFYGNGQSTA